MTENKEKGINETTEQDGRFKPCFIDSIKCKYSKQCN